MAINDFLSLLSSATGGSGLVATPEQIAETERLKRQFPNAPQTAVDPMSSVPGQEMLVQRTLNKEKEDTSTPVYTAPEVDRVEPGRLAMKELIPRKGMFGVKGTLRDVIGTIGDAFLIQGGRDPLYAPHRRRERIGGAAYGIDPNDPVSLQAGIDRLNAQGFPEEAQKLQEQIATQALRRSQIESAGAARESQIGARRDKAIMDARNYSSRLLAAAGNDPARLSAAMNQIQKMSMALGLDPEKDLGIGAEMSPEERAVYGSADMTVRQQTDIPFQERKVRAAEQQADASTLRASRPPAGRAAPQRTYAQVEAEAFDTPADQRTPDQQAIVRARTEGRGGRGGVASRAAAKVTSGPPKVNIQQHPVGSTINYANGKSGVVQKDGSVKLKN